jgi:hypothetical protein
MTNKKTYQDRIISYYRNNVWKFTKDHQSAWFSFIANVMLPEEVDAADGLRSLKALSLRPIRQWHSPYYGQSQAPSLWAVTNNHTKNFVLPPHLRKPTDYFTWTKKPWDAGLGPDVNALKDRTTLDYLLPYWLGKHFKLF